MTDFGDSFGTSTSDKAGDHELQEFLMVEKQKAQFNAQVIFIRLSIIHNKILIFSFIDSRIQRFLLGEMCR